MLGIIAAIVAYIVWGAGSPIFKYALTDIPPFTLAFIRFFFASILFLPFVLAHKNQIKKKHLKNLVLGAFWGISVNVGFFFLGLKLAPSINATIIGSSGSMLLYLLSLKILHEKPHAQIIRGMGIAFLGVLIIVGAPLIQSFELSSISDGVGWKSFLGNLCFLAMTLGGVMMMVENKQINGKIHPYTITGIQFFIGSLVFIPFMIPELQSWSFSEMTEKSWIGILYGVFFSSVIAYMCINYALSKMHAQQMGIFSYITPIMSVLVAIPLLGEVPDIFFIVGSIFIGGGFVVAEAHTRKKRR
ncbi:MAG: DMT family transporter [bacterium]|nr:DMT family transporter [bacterium]